MCTSEFGILKTDAGYQFSLKYSPQDGSNMTENRSQPVALEPRENSSIKLRDTRPGHMCCTSEFGILKTDADYQFSRK